MVVSNGQLCKENSQETPPKPTVLAVIQENIPAELKSIPNWMCWCYELRRSSQGEWKWTKPPIQTNSNYAQSNQPRTWTTFERVWEHFVHPVGIVPDGIGFRPTGTIVGIDLDHCRDPETGAIADWASGIRIFCHGKLPPGRRKNGNVEMYDESSPKYLTITGHHVVGTPLSLEQRQTEIEEVHAEHLGVQGDKPEHERESVAVEPVRPPETRSLPTWVTVEEIIERASQAANGTKFLNLWRGKYEVEGFPSQSDADASLCAILVFWTGPDPVMLDACFRESGLYRAKWNEQRGTLTYGQRTIEYALSRVSEYFDWGVPMLDEEVHRICKPFDLSQEGTSIDLDLYDDCPDERPAPGELAAIDPGLDLDHRAGLDRTSAH